MQADPETNELAALRAFLTDRPRALTLELGCGDGRLVERALSLGVELIGLDTTIAAVVQARREKGLSRVLVADGRYLPFRDACFDQAVYGWSL